MNDRPTSEPREEEQETYDVLVDCSNCGLRHYSHSGRVEIPKGTSVGETPCPVCGCTTLRAWR